MTARIAQSGSSLGDLSIDHAWQIVGDLYSEVLRDPKSVGRQEIESELLFCLLGGYGITYEHSRSAADVIWGLRPFSDHWEEHELLETIASELMQPQFGPEKLDGSLRRYRFPFRKASIVVKARAWLQRNGPILRRLTETRCCRERRRILSDCPGMGPKTASWLLRNIGLGDELAIIDIHVCRALFEAGRITDDVQMPRDYELIEDAFLEWCNELSAPPDTFDLFIWDWQRGALSSF